VCRGSLTSIATRYGLKGPGIVFLWGTRYSTAVQTWTGPTKFSVKWVPGLFPGGKGTGCDVDHPHIFNAKFKERVQLYHYFPLDFHGLFCGAMYLFML